jgi:signal transduction histidine kinase
MADPRRITQVLINLITNAHKYGPPEGTIRVAVTRRDASVYIAVSDSGPGISASDQRGLFQRFIRASSSSDANERGGVSGVGVGLAIVREIVTLHHGQVGLESEPERGTTVWFTLPLASQVVTAPVVS